MYLNKKNINFWFFYIKLKKNYNQEKKIKYKKIKQDEKKY